jgi:hypothetical protein
MSQRFASCTCGRLQLGCQGEPVWTENKHAWLCLPEDMQVFAATPAREQSDVGPGSQRA